MVQLLNRLPGSFKLRECYKGVPSFLVFAVYTGELKEEACPVGEVSVYL